MSWLTSKRSKRANSLIDEGIIRAHSVTHVPFEGEKTPFISLLQAICNPNVLKTSSQVVAL